MTGEITLHLPESFMERVGQIGTTTRHNLEVVLSDAVEILWPMLEDLPETAVYPAITHLSDAEVLELADAKMDTAQNQRLGQLQAKGKTVGLSAAERYELLALMQIYQIGQLRKSEALAEAVQRGLRMPLPA